HPKCVPSCPTKPWIRSSPVPRSCPRCSSARSQNTRTSSSSRTSASTEGLPRESGAQRVHALTPGNDSDRRRHGRRMHRQCHREFRAGADLRTHLDLAAVAFDDLVSDRQSQPCSLAYVLGREERIEYFRQYVWCNPLAIVLDVDGDVRRVRSARGDR